MAIRNIRELGDDILRKKCRTVDVIDDKIITLLNDMIETMHKADGVGLAAPQIGILKRIAVIDIDGEVIELINPTIISFEGAQYEAEGCLSVPGKYGKVKRPAVVTVEATNRNGEVFQITGDDLLARALCHEIDHLDGKLFVDSVIEYVEVDK